MAFLLNVVGADLNVEHSAAQFTVGTRAYGNDGSEWIYVKADAGGVTGAGYVVLIDENYDCDMIDTTNSASGRNQLVGVSPIAVTASYYFWAQIGGTCSIRVAASAAANTVLNSTATAGQLDDDATMGAEVVDRLTLTTARGGSAGTAEGVIFQPVVGATL